MRAAVDDASCGRLPRHSLSRRLLSERQGWDTNTTSDLDGHCRFSRLTCGQRSVLVVATVPVGSAVRPVAVAAAKPATARLTFWVRRGRVRSQPAPSANDLSPRVSERSRDAAPMAASAQSNLFPIGVELGYPPRSVQQRQRVVRA
jgi:hypothetical protein